MIQLSDLEDCVKGGEIQIAPGHQNNRIGTQVLVDVMGRARQRGRDVILSTGLMNASAYRLFKRLGFEETGRSETHIHLRCDTSER